MGGSRYTTIIPAYDVTVGKDYQGIYTLIGNDFMDFPSDEVGMCPVVVEVSDRYRTVEEGRRAWKGFLRHLFGSEPTDEEWWMPVYGGINDELFKVYEEWMKQLLKDAEHRGVIDWHAELDIEAQLYESNLLPATVLESACHVCARPGDWTLVLTPLLHQEEPGGPLRRWRWNPPSYPDRDAAQLSHMKGIDEFQERCSRIWEDYKKTLDADAPEQEFKTFDELGGSDYEDYISDIEQEAADDGLMVVKEAHQPLWFPSRWLVEDALEEVAAVYKRLYERHGHRNRRSLDLATEPLDRWLTALTMERNLRTQFNGWA